MISDGDETISEKMRNAGDRNRKRAVSTAILRELKEEYLDAPVEDSQASERKMSLSRENKRKIEYEENYMTRLPVGKQEKHRNRQFSTLNTLGDEITTFGGSLSSKNKRKRNNDKGKKRMLIINIFIILLIFTHFIYSSLIYVLYVSGFKKKRFT